MRKLAIALTLVIAACALCGLLAACSGSSSSDDLASTRDVSWDGTELTVTVGTNKSTGCEWETEFEDDSIIDYSINRVFHLSKQATSEGQAYGTSDIGYEGKSAGTTHIYLSTPKDWDGNEPGYTCTVTVTVNDDGTIADATIE